MKLLPGSKIAIGFGTLAAAGFLFISAYQFYYEVPVLMYHRVDNAAEKSNTLVSADAFEKQMEFLKAHRYHVLPLSELISVLKSGKKVSANSVVITFDDGSADNVRNAFPILKKMGFPATVFMITGNIGKADWLTEEDLRILEEGGILIGSHTASHAFLPKLSPEEVTEELRGSKKKLEAVLGHPVTLLSYPAGGVTPEIEAAAQAAGYEGAVTTNHLEGRRDPYALHRIKVGESSRNLFNFWLKTSGFYHLGKKRIVSE